MKKIIAFFILFFVFIGVSNSYSSNEYLYINKNSTKVFFNTNSSYKFLFYEGYKVKASDDFVGSLRKVYLTDGKKAYIDDSNLSSYIDDKYMLESNSATLKSEKFPLFSVPNAKGNSKIILYRGTKFNILNKNLINTSWVRVKVISGKNKGKVGFVWYKGLYFDNYNDNQKKTSIILDEIINNNSNSNNNSSDHQGSSVGSYPQVYADIMALKYSDNGKYQNIMEQIVLFKTTDNKIYRAIAKKFKNEYTSLYNDLMATGKEFSNNFNSGSNPTYNPNPTYNSNSNSNSNPTYNSNSNSNSNPTYNSNSNSNSEDIQNVFSEIPGFPGLSLPE